MYLLIAISYLHNLGLFNFIQLVLLLMIFFISNTLIGIKPYNLNLQIIRLISIIVILIVIYNNSNEIIYSSHLLPPYSWLKIDYVNDFLVKSLNYYHKKFNIFYLKNLTKDITIFLDNLNENDNYWLSLSFYPNIEAYKNDEGIKMYICDPILINRDSSPILLSKFIMNRLNLMIDLYYLDDSIFDSNDSVIITEYTEIELE